MLCSVICKDYVAIPLKDIGPKTSMKLVNTDNSDLAQLGTLVMKVNVDNIHTEHVDHLLVAGL